MIIVEIAGHLGADPEVRFAASGQKVITMRVATKVRRQGKDETVWWRLTVFGDRFDKMLTYLKKGSAIIAIGEMNPPSIWADKDGKSHVQLELIAEMLRFSPFGKSEHSEGGAAAPYGQQSKPQQQNSGYAPQYGSHQSMDGGSEMSYGSPQSPSQGANLTSAGKFDGGFGSHGGPSHQEDEPLPF